MEVRSLYVEPEREAAPLQWPALECHDVFKIYRSGPVETVALRGLDLRIERGEIVAVLGHNGSGKSTLVKILAGVYQADLGAVVEVRDAEGNWLRDRRSVRSCTSSTKISAWPTS